MTEAMKTHPPAHWQPRPDRPPMALFLGCLVLPVLLWPGCPGMSVSAASISGLPEQFDAPLRGPLLGRMAVRIPALADHLEATTTFQAVPNSSTVLVRTELANTGKKTIEIRTAPLLDATIPLNDPKPNPTARMGNFEPEKTWYESHYWTAGGWSRVGKNWHHPGPDQPTVRTFECPRGGRVTVSGRAFKLHRDGDGVIATIRHNLEPIWSAHIAGKDGQGIDPGLKLKVDAGDRIRFVVASGPTIFCDTTGWDPAITYEDGITFRASKGFSGTQGKNNWFYETLGDGLPPIPPPRQTLLDRDLLPHISRLTAGLVTRADGRSALPFVILSDGQDKSGFSLAVDADRAWRFDSSGSADGRTLRIRMEAEVEAELAPGNRLALPVLAFTPYTGTGAAALAALLSLTRRSSPLPRLAAAAARTRQERAEATGDLPELDLLILTQAEWVREDGIDGRVQSYRKAAMSHLDRARALLAAGDRGPAPRGKAGEFAGELAALETDSRELPEEDPEGWRRLYTKVRWFKRRILFFDPLLDFRKILFAKRRLCRWSHLNMQYFGFRARAGGGIFVLEDAGRSLAIRNVVGEQLPPGSFLEPRLSYAGDRVVFSYVACGDRELDAKSLVQNEEGEDVGYYHIYEIGVDGRGLRQLTRGTYDDVMPTYLPDGGIAFCSTRRQSYSRCFGPNYSKRWHAYTVHRMDGGGANLRILSRNDVTEWFPSVNNTGHLLFARWDYIDRHAVWHQNLWAMRPDGTNQIALWGNAVNKPHCTFQIQPVPNSRKIAFIASAHHALTGGPVCLLDPSMGSNRQDAVQRITPQPFPEAESFRLPDYYEFVWPLAERLFLVGYSNTYLRSQGQSYKDPTPDNALGIYLLDRYGNRELIYRDPLLNSSTPIPLRPRLRPPILTRSLPFSAPATGELLVTNIYRGLGDVAPGTIKALRVVQIFPKTTPYANTPRIGFAGEENARAVLGTVPVERDGSARFTVPAGKLLLFQALDENGCAYQTMRSTLAVQPGETASCVGCHENRTRAPGNHAPLALRRPPSALEVGEFDGMPFSYMTVVQPIWDRRCVSCHGEDKPEKGVKLTGTPRDGYAESYWALCGPPGSFDGGKTNPENAGQALVPRFGQRNPVERSPPGGRYGARGSRLLNMLRKGHEKVELDDDELRRIAMWIDLNAIFYGAYLEKRRAAQLAGESIPMPEIE